MIVPTNDELISARLVGSGRLVRFKTNGETIGGCPTGRAPEPGAL